MEYTIHDVKKLREITGYGLKDCKDALENADGNLQKAAKMLLCNSSVGQENCETVKAEPQNKEQISMKECKILTFYYASDAKLEVNVARQLKTFGQYYTEKHIQRYNCRLEDHPQWESEVNSYLAAGWTIQSMTSNDSHRSITFLLVR